MPSHSREVYSGIRFMRADSSLSPSDCNEELGTDSGRIRRILPAEFDEEGPDETTICVA